MSDSRFKQTPKGYLIFKQICFHKIAQMHWLCAHFLVCVELTYLTQLCEYLHYGLAELFKSWSP